MAVISMRQMLEAGAHFGHQTRRWNPKMKRFIFGERNGIYIIDLEQTLGRVDTAYGFVRDLVAKGGTLLFVGTKKQAQDPIRSYAEKCNMPYVNERWLGGMLTNFDTIAKRIGKMLEYERMQRAGDFDQMPKKEALMLSRELEKLQRNLGGLRGLTKRPDAIFVLDTKKEHIAVTEANKLRIPVVAVVDTNVDPELVDYPMPGNDDAIRANTLFARVVAEAVAEGRYIANRRAPAPEAPTRSAEDEAAFEAEQANARRQAAQAAAERESRLSAARVQAETGPEPEAAAPAAETAAIDEPVVASTATAAPDADADVDPTEVAEETAPAADDAAPAADEPASAGDYVPATTAEGSASDEADAARGGSGADDEPATSPGSASDEADASAGEAEASQDHGSGADDEPATSPGSASDEADAARGEADDESGPSAVDDTGAAEGSASDEADAARGESEADDEPASGKEN